MSRVEDHIGRLHHLYPKLIDLSLERLTSLLAKLGNPERKLPPVIHVAGTNGKGSVCAFARAIAEAAGLRVHVYTSPHLVSFNERIRLAGVLATDAVLESAFAEMETANGGAPITVFEAITAVGFILFARVPADLCILEVGLGGKFDATNVLPNPAASAITSISMDHMDFLGDDIESIAGEKAGIIKPGVPVVTGRQTHAAMRVLATFAATQNAPLSIRDRDWHIEPTESGLRFSNATRSLPLPQPSLPGAHQIENAGIAIQTLKSAGFHWPDAVYQTGLARAEWPARLQRLNGALHHLLPAGSELWLDGAHNPGGADALAVQLQNWSGPTTLIVGMKQSKDVGEFLARIMPFAKTLYAIAEPDQHLALPIADIIAASAHRAIPGPDLAGALRQITTPTRVLICGSLYLAGVVLKRDGVLAASNPPNATRPAAINNQPDAATKPNATSNPVDATGVI